MAGVARGLQAYALPQRVPLFARTMETVGRALVRQTINWGLAGAHADYHHAPLSSNNGVVHSSATGLAWPSDATGGLT